MPSYMCACSGGSVQPVTLNMLRAIQPGTINMQNTLSFSMTDSERALRTLLASEGDINLAAERLAVDIPSYIGFLADDTDMLHRSLRTLALIKAFQTLMATHLHIIEALPNMREDNLVKTLQILSQNVDRLTDDRANLNININEHIWKLLPPDAREAIQVLQQPNVIDN